MIRRRRPEREIAFSFDSFLDVVTNVVGIILRLILVAWVGARAYKGPPMPALPTPPGMEEVAELPDPQDPLAAKLEKQRHELVAAQNHLLEQVKAWDQLRERRALSADELAALRQKREGLEAQRSALERVAGQRGQGASAIALSMAEVQERGKRLFEEIEALRKAPPMKQTLRYRTPVSRPLQSEELLFECRGGRVTFIDIGSMLDEIRQNLRDKADQLKTRYEVSDVTTPAGPFQLRYHIERERAMLEGVSPAPQASFRYGLTGWEVEPIAQERGETVDQALAPQSAFRRVIESIDPHQTAVTLCVYPDSFPLYRRLRDYLHERDVEVAGRPLPHGVPIASSRHGTASRGQ
jgi:hypothetical protein